MLTPTQFRTTFQIGCMTAAGYGIGIALKVNPKAVAITWLSAEIALQILKAKRLPSPKVLAGCVVSVQLSAQKIIENSARSYFIMTGIFAISSILIDKTINLFTKRWQAIPDSDDIINPYQVDYDRIAYYDIRG